MKYIDLYKILIIYKQIKHTNIWHKNIKINRLFDFMKRLIVLDSKIQTFICFVDCIVYIILTPVHGGLKF